MKRCPITYETISDGEGSYSGDGIRKLSRSLTHLQDLAFSAEEQRREAVVRATKMSIQGVQPKLSARLRVKEGRFEIVDQDGRYILKPQNHLYRSLPENEDLTMRLAATVGIEVPLHGLVFSSDGSLTYFIKRFDRVGRNEKLAVEDFAQLAGRTRGTKYDFSMERLVPLIDRHCTFPAVERIELFRRTLFCYLTGNEDMHLKNFSIITRKNVIKLSPAYDLVNSTLVLSRAVEELALPLKGKKRNLTRNDLVRYFGEERLDLTRRSMDDVMSAFSDARPTWKSIIERSFLPVDLQDAYASLLHERVERLRIGRR